jgi:coenzyme F420-reducing hydrogenase alpha subunit
VVSPEGYLDILLKIADQRVKAVEILNQRPLQAANLLIGKSPTEAHALIPRLFSLCGTAQSLAGLSALEDAAGIVPDAGQQAHRASLLAAETAREHAMRIFIDWPRLINESPDAVSLKRLRAAIAAHDRGLAEALLEDGLGGDPCLDPISWADRGASPPARLLRRILDLDLKDFGVSPLKPLPRMDIKKLAKRLDEEVNFTLHPDWNGEVYETGAFSRHPGANNGLLTRFIAQLTELRQAIAMLAPGEEKVSSPPEPNSGQGIALVEAARGRLVHRVIIKEGKIAAWRILAPTEWNFHPNGAFARGLLGAKLDADLAFKAEMLAVAIDPCVAVKIRVE